MIKEYILDGLSCANCAAKIEGEVKELDGVSFASVNLMTTLLQIDVSDLHVMDLLSSVIRIVKQHEPDVTVVEKESGGQAKTGSNGEIISKKKLLPLIAGTLVFACGVVLERFFRVDEYVVLAVFVASYLLLGGKVILRAFTNIAKGKVFDEHFLMAAATIGAFAIGEYAEAAGVMLFYYVGELLQEAAVGKSRRTITSLLDMRPDYANLLKDGDYVKISPEIVNIGDAILVKPGERIPLDGVVVEGESMVDLSALTGESTPVPMAAEDEVMSGSVNLSGALTVEVTRTFGRSTASRIIELAQNAVSKKAPAENYITKFAKYYTPSVVALAFLIAVIPPLAGAGEWSGWLNRGLIFLVISCPCALVISIPLGFFGGIGSASRKGILVKGGNYLEALNDPDIIVFDKTGTLTKGEFKVTEVKPSEGTDARELLETAAYAEAFSNHPVALSILREYGSPVDKRGLTGHTELAGHGVSVVSSGQTIVAGNEALMAEMEIAIDKPEGIGTKVYVAKDGQYIGYIMISDEIKQDSKAAVRELKKNGAGKIVMLTGDNAQIAEAVARELGIDEVHAELLPHDKVEKVEELKKQKRADGKLVFIGDGINDAPVLAMADVGVAMGGLGSDAAIEAADVVLMTDEPSKLSEAIKVARFTKRVVRQNIALSIGIKAAVLLLGALGFATMWEAVFADVGVAMLAVINAMRVVRR